MSSGRKSKISPVDTRPTLVARMDGDATISALFVEPQTQRSVPVALKSTCTAGEAIQQIVTGSAKQPGKCLLCIKLKGFPVIPLHLPFSAELRSVVPTGASVQLVMAIGLPDSQTAAAPPAVVTSNSVAQSLKDRLTRFYLKYNPSKLPEVDRLVESYESNTEALFQALTMKYGPE